MKAEIVQVHSDFISIGADNQGIEQHIRGTWSIELVLVEGGGLTFEQACEFQKNKTKFTLIPIDQ